MFNHRKETISSPCWSPPTLVDILLEFYVWIYCDAFDRDHPLFSEAWSLRHIFLVFLDGSSWVLGGKNHSLDHSQQPSWHHHPLAGQRSHHHWTFRREVFHLYFESQNPRLSWLLCWPEWSLFFVCRLHTNGSRHWKKTTCSYIIRRLLEVHRELVSMIRTEHPNTSTPRQFRFIGHDLARDAG